METININKPNTQSVGSFGTDSLTLGGVEIQKGGKTETYWSGPQPFYPNLPTITRNIDCLMTKFLNMTRRVPRSIDIETDDSRVTYTYSILGEDQNARAVMEFKSIEDINEVVLKMVGRLSFKFLTVMVGVRKKNQLRSHFDRMVGRMELTPDEVHVVETQFSDDVEKYVGVRKGVV